MPFSNAGCVISEKNKKYSALSILRRGRDSSAAITNAWRRWRIWLLFRSGASAFRFSLYRAPALAWHLQSAVRPVDVGHGSIPATKATDLRPASPPLRPWRRCRYCNKSGFAYKRADIILMESPDEDMPECCWIAYQRFARRFLQSWFVLQPPSVRAEPAFKP